MSVPAMLVLAPHPDDETLGAGGTIAALAGAGGEVTVLTVAGHLPPLYPPEVHEQRLVEARRAHTVLGVKEAVFLDYPAVLLGQVPVPELNARVKEVVERVRPDVLLVPFLDRHLDHRLVFEAAMVAARPVGVGRGIGVVAAYETVSSTHWNAPHLEPTFAPNWCVDISNHIDAKLEALSRYESELDAFPGARSMEAVRALALFRGSQAGCGFAEGFHVLRMSVPPHILALGPR
ncbi:MAG TPA: PIG-L deacetylase family protein [Acidimicrobiales bacterium]|nr:PIG-L deacetylase family protein [Acidimicrobiales bacterium]